MPNGNNGGGGWRGWALGLVGSGLLAIGGMSYSTMEKRVTRAEDRSDRIERKVDAVLWTLGVDPDRVERVIFRAEKTAEKANEPNGG